MSSTDFVGNFTANPTHFTELTSAVYFSSYEGNSKLNIWDKVYGAISPEIE